MTFRFVATGEELLKGIDTESVGVFRYDNEYHLTPEEVCIIYYTYMPKI